VGVDEIEGVLSLAFKLPGLTVDSSESSFLVVAAAAAFSTNEVVDSFLGVGGVASRGSGRSSREKIDKSSPFHWSPS
jgi:hypothetical protein